MTKVEKLSYRVEQEIVKHGLYPEPVLFKNARDKDLAAISVTSDTEQDIFVNYGTIWLNNQEINALPERRWIMEVPLLSARTRDLASQLERIFSVQVSYDVLNGRASTISKHDRYVYPTERVKRHEPPEDTSWISCL